MVVYINLVVRNINKYGIKFYEKLYYSYDVFDSSDKKLSERDVREFFQRVIPKDDDSFEF